MRYKLRAFLLGDFILLVIGWVFVLAHELPWEIGAEIGEREIAHGNVVAGERILRNAIASAEENAPEDPRLATALSRLARYLSTEGRYAEAESYQLRALAVREKAFGREHPDIAASFNDLGLLYHAQGWHTAAEPLLLQALAIRRQTLGPTDALTAESLTILADAETASGRHAEARGHYEEALAIAEKVHGPEHPSVAPILSGLALLEKANGRRAAAEQHLTRALEIITAELEKRSPLSVRTLASLVSAGGHFGWSLDATGSMGRALTSARSKLGLKSHELAAIHNNLGVIVISDGRSAEAEAHFKQAADIEEALGPPKLLASRIQYNMGRLYSLEGQHAEARRAYEQALRIAQKALRPGHPLSVRISERLAAAG